MNKSITKKGDMENYLALKEDPGYYEPSWISVEDSLPKEWDMVLVWDGTYLYQGQFRNLDDPKDGFLTYEAWLVPHHDTGYMEEHKVAEISHWRPLPKLPKGNSYE
jgi:hypothetical protein